MKRKKKTDRYVSMLILAVAVATLVLTGLRIFGVAIPVIWILSPIWIPAMGILLYVAVYICREDIREKREIRRRKKWH